MGNSEFRQLHLSIPKEVFELNDGLGPYFLLPGSDGRAKQIASYLENVKTYTNPRQLNTYVGEIKRNINGQEHTIYIAANSTGMGAPSVEIVLTELIMMGAKRLLRVGTAGSLQPDKIKVGSIVIATAAIRDDHAADDYIDRDYPAVADHSMVVALKRAARNLGVEDKTFAGVVQTKATLYAREFYHGPRAEEHKDYMRRITEMGAVASEMEAAQFFIMAQYYSEKAFNIKEEVSSPKIVKAGGVMAIISDCVNFAEGEIVH